MATTFPKLYVQRDFDRLVNCCRGIDGSELVKTFLGIQFETGKRAGDVMRSPEFRFAFELMLDEAREKAGVA